MPVCKKQLRGYPMMAQNPDHPPDVREAAEAIASLFSHFGCDSGAVVQELEDIIAHHTRLAKIRAALEEIEWIADPERRYVYCPACNNNGHAGHRSDCTTRRALHGEPRAEDGGRGT
jgi:hypothetical protein